MDTHQDTYTREKFNSLPLREEITPILDKYVEGIPYKAYVHYLPDLLCIQLIPDKNTRINCDLLQHELQNHFGVPFQIELLIRSSH